MAGLSTLVDTVARHRVLLGSGLAAASVASALSVLAPTPPQVAQVLVAARDLTAGRPLGPDDVRIAHVPVDVVPDGALSGDVTGRLLVGAVRANEMLTDVRLLGPGLLPEPGLVAAPVRVADPAVRTLVSPGDRVDVLAAATEPSGSEHARTVAADVAVLAVPDLPDDLAEGALLVVAATPSGAARLASAAVSGRLSVVIRAR